MGTGKKFKTFPLKKNSPCRKFVIQPTAYLYTFQKLIAFTNTLTIVIPYLSTLPNLLGYRPQPTSFRQAIRIEHEKPSNFVSRSESNITSTKNTRQLSARLEDHCGLSTPLSSLCHILLHRFIHAPPTPRLLTLRLPSPTSPSSPASPYLPNSPTSPSSLKTKTRAKIAFGKRSIGKFRLKNALIWEENFVFHIP